MPRGEYKVRLDGGPANGKRFTVYRQEKRLEVEQGGKTHIYEKKNNHWEESDLHEYKYVRTK